MDDTGDATLAEVAKSLADGIVAAVPGWVERCVDTIHRAWAGPPPPSIVDEARSAGVAAAADVGPRLWTLLAADIDEQRSTPLAIVRDAVSYPTSVLEHAGVPPVVRDQVAEAMFPEDAYGLTPATLAELTPALGETAIAWGAAKAMAHRRRHT